MAKRRTKSPDSDPRALTVSHGAGAQVCFDSIFRVELGEKQKGPPVQLCRRVLVAIASNGYGGEVSKRAGVTQHTVDQCVAAMLECGLIRVSSITKRYEPAWLAISRFAKTE